MTDGVAPVIDTHTHVISPDRSRFPLETPDFPAVWVSESPVAVDGLLAALDAGGVSGAVLVQAKGAYGFDNAYVAEARDAAPPRLVNAAVIDLAAAGREPVLRYWCVERSILGLRVFNIPAADPDWLRDPSLPGLLRLASELGVRLSVCILAPDLPAVGRLLAALPDVPIAIDHCGFVELGEGTRSAGAQSLTDLAAFDNVRLKVTTTILTMAEQAGMAAADVVEWLCEGFGAERLMWGSDYPQHHSEPYPEIVEYGRRACSRLSPSEQARFLGGTALELWPELMA
ncbi:MAG TPA: amidohydrolase family protein [Frankiaceae bacterium]|jgi:predicted TIM-barrel fold metal-dependent hydrolase|nr:amidohydrolase family protein [Frankiaceae bacterium]